MFNRPTPSDDVIDSRDVIEAIEELKGLIEDAGDNDVDAERDELRALEAFAADASEVADWRFGETFIRDSYFKDYAMELADDIGAIDRNAQWPTNCIDWDKAARELRMDYTPYEFDGVTYWARA